MAINFQELIKDKKVKSALVICIAIIASSILLYIMFAPESESDVRNDKEVMVGDDASRLNFEVPTTKDSTLENGTKIDAFEKKFSDSVTYARKTEDALNFNTSSNTNSNNTDTGFSDADFEKMRKSSLSNSSIAPSKPSNSHSTYGNSSMWGDDIPSGSNVGYSDLGNVITKPQGTKRKPVSQPTYKNTEVADDINFETQFNTPSYTNTAKPEITAKTAKPIRAKLISSGYATTGRSLSFVLLDPITINGEQTKRGQVITGSTIVDDNRVIVRFVSLKVNNKNLPITAKLVGYDGGEGLPVRGNNNGNGAGDVIRDEAQSQVSRIPVVGGLIGRATSSGNRKNDDKIQLSSNIECTIMFYQ